jgi:transcriptional regulator with GAF, ATPase, and Fis domain
MLLIAVDLRGETSEEDRSLADEVITKLDKSVIIHAVQDVLQLARAQDGRLIEAEQRAADEALARRIDEIQTLMALSQSLTEVLELTEVLNRVVEAARRLTNADEGMILLPDDEVGQLYLRAKVGIDVEAARNFRIKTQDTLAGQVFSSGQPILIGDQATEGEDRDLSTCLCADPSRALPSACLGSTIKTSRTHST